MEENQKKKLTKTEKWFRFLRRMEKSIFKVLFPNVKYNNNPPFDEGNYLFVSNHYSVLDVTVCVALCHRPVYFMAKKELWDSRIGRWFVTKSECIPVQRDGNDVKAVMQAMRKLKNGDIVYIFPEGTRNKTKEPFLPFKGGAALLSLRTKTPIVPIVFMNKFKLFHKTVILVGEPFEFTEYYDKKLTEEDYAVCEKMLYDKMVALRENYLLEKQQKKSNKKSK